MKRKSISASLLKLASTNAVLRPNIDRADLKKLTNLILEKEPESLDEAWELLAPQEWVSGGAKRKFAIIGKSGLTDRPTTVEGMLTVALLHKSMKDAETYMLNAHKK